MELLPCLFCASTSAKGHVREYTGTGLYTIICPECRAEGPAHIGKFVARDVMEVLCPGADSYDRDARRHSPGIAAAGELWNTRSPITKLLLRNIDMPTFKNTDCTTRAGEEIKHAPHVESFPLFIHPDDAKRHSTVGSNHIVC